MSKNITICHTFQQGSSNALRVTDQSAWYVVKETWEGARLANVQPVHRCADRATALLVARALDGEPTVLDEYVHEHEGAWVAARFNPDSGRYERPLDAEERQASGCHTLFGPLSYMGSYTTQVGAIKRALVLWPNLARVTA